MFTYLLKAALAAGLDVPSIKLIVWVVVVSAQASICITSFWIGWRLMGAIDQRMERRAMRVPSATRP